MSHNKMSKAQISGLFSPEFLMYYPCIAVVDTMGTQLFNEGIFCKGHPVNDKRPKWRVAEQNTSQS